MKDNYNIPYVYLVLIKENKILLQERINTGYFDGMYSFVAGKIDKNESLKNAIIRESKEEIGIKIDDPKIIHLMHRKQDGENTLKIDVFFYVNKYKGEIKNCIPEKCSDLKWFKINDLPNNTAPYIKKIINKIKEGEFYSEYGF